MRWRQCAQTGQFIPMDAAAAAHSDSASGVIVRGNFNPFVSPVDGTVIRTQRDLDNHNKRNDVVNAAEFTPEFYAEKAKERERIRTGQLTRQESLARKKQLYEIITKAERQHGW